MKEQKEMVKWECPECQEDHEDVEGRETHCRKCGLIVTPYDGCTYDEGQHVDVALKVFTNGTDTYVASSVKDTLGNALVK